MVVASSEREKTTKNNSSTHTRMYATNMFNYQKIYSCMTPDTRIVKFSHDAARSAEIEIDIVPLSHPLAHLRGNLLLIYREKEVRHVH